MSDAKLRAFLSLLGSFALNLLYALWEILCGLYYQSYWFITLGFYYILLTLIRLTLLRQARYRGQADRSGRRRYRICGILLLMMNGILFGIVMLAVTGNQAIHYAGYLIYAVAAYTFYRVVIAIVTLVRYRNWNAPALTASKVISLVTALVSLLSLEIAMILQFGGDGEFFRTMTVLTGAGVGVGISVAAICMLHTPKNKTSHSE
ncbi:MAG: hypothetical protein LUE21_03135 [Oscillospiraceae bacterium]|nr:hypothetical protein [Oscillospiraceae bacterium]